MTAGLLGVAACLAGAPVPAAATSGSSHVVTPTLSPAQRGAGGAAPAGVGSPAYTNQSVAHVPGGVPVSGYSAPLEESWLPQTTATGAEPNIGITTDPASSVGYDVFTDAFTNVLKTADGGATWTDVTPRLSGGLPAHPTSLDPYLRVDTTTNRVFKADLASTCQFFSYSDDRGATWTNNLTACNLSDHETIATGPPVISPTVGYPNIVYNCSQSGGYNGDSTASICDKSLDGGLTFVATGSPAFADPSPYGTGPNSGDSGIPGHCLGDVGPIYVDSAGTLYMSRGWCGQPWVAVSHDEGATWTRTQVATNGMNTTLPSQTTPPGLDDSGCGGFGLMAPGSGQSDHEAAVVADGKGDVFFFWMALDRLPYLAVSTDGGTSFGAPMMVGAPGVKEAWGPVIGFRDGHVALAYMGSTNSPGAPWGCGSAYNSVTFTGYVALIESPLDASPVIYSAPVTPPSYSLAQGNCGPDRCNNTINDFLDVKIAPDGSAWGAYVDSTAAKAGAPLVGELFAPGPQINVPETPVPALAVLVTAAAVAFLAPRRRRRRRTRLPA